MKAEISRRGAGKMAVAAVAAAAVPEPAHSEMGDGPVVQSSRFTPGVYAAGKPAIFYDVLEPATGASRPPIMMIHGGGHTGSCFLTTADGRPGWAHYFASRGHRVLVPDWAGTGRSSGVPLDRIDGAMVHAGLADVLTTATDPVVLLVHSMGGTFGWKLLETHGSHIRKLVAVAPAPPGNIQPAAAVVSRGPNYVDVQQPAAVIRLYIDQPFFPPEVWADGKLIGTGTQFPREQRDAYLASLQSIPPRLLLERTNVDSKQLRITDFTGFAQKPVLLVIGTNDLDHTEAADRPIVAWLNSNGAQARLLPLGERGITGNGHMMMMERNSDAIAAVIAEWANS